MPRGHGLPRGQLAHRFGGSHVRVEVRAPIPRIAAAEIARRVLLGTLHIPGEEAAAERRERHEADAELAQQRDDTRFEVALPQRVLALERRDRVHGVGAADRILASLGEAEEADLPLAHELGHRADDVLDRHSRVHAVLIEQVDPVGGEAAERALDGFADVCRAAVQPRDPAVRVELEAELGGDDDPVASALELLEGARQQFLVLVRPVCLGGVEEGAPQLDGPMDGGDGLALVALLRGAVRVAHPHQAEAEHGDSEVLRAECACG